MRFLRHPSANVAVNGPEFNYLQIVSCAWVIYQKYDVSYHSSRIHFLDVIDPL